MLFFKQAAAVLALASAVMAPAASAAVVTLPTSALSASNGVYTPNGYYTNHLGQVAVMTGGGVTPNVGGVDGRNDDGYMALNLGFSFSFFGQTYTSLFLNNNGNVSFGSGISAYDPEGPTGANAPIISTYFGDVDTTNAASGVMRYSLSANQLVVTWDQVGYFDGNADLLNSFQLVLRSNDYVLPQGEGQIGFFYGNMDWEQTDTSQTAAVGFGDGQGNAVVIAGSNTPGMNNVVDNQYIWFDPNLRPVEPQEPGEVPEPASVALVGMALAGLAANRRRKKA